MIPNNIARILNLDDVEAFKKEWDGLKDIIFSIRGSHSNILHEACSREAEQITIFILRQNYIGINTTTNFNKTPLMLLMVGISKAVEEILEELFRHPNLDCDIVDNKGETALIKGLDSGIAERYNLLCLERMKNLNLKNPSGESILDICLKRYETYRLHSTLVYELIERDAYVSDDNLLSVMRFIKGDLKTSIIWKLIQTKDKLIYRVYEIAAKDDEFINFLPDDIKDIFIF